MYKNCPTNSECLAELLLKLKKQKEILQNNNLKGPKSLAMPFTDSGDMYVVPNAFQTGTQSSISAFKIKNIGCTENEADICISNEIFNIVWI